MKTTNKIYQITLALTILAATLNARNAQSQNLFVSQDHSIQEFTPGGTGSLFGTVPGSFGTAVRGLAFNSAGDLFAAGEGGGIGVIDEFTPTGVESTFASGLDGPMSLAFNNAGTLFLGDSSGKISQFTSGGVQSTFASGLSTSYATALAFNSAGDLFVGESYNGTPNSGYIDEITPNGVVSIFASGLISPYALAFNSAGDLFAADYISGNIYEFAPNGARSTFATGLSNPEGLAFNSAGDLFESNSGTDTIYEFTPDGVRSTFANLAGEYPPDALAFQPLPVPEPSASALLVVGAAALFVRRGWLTRKARMD